MTNLRMRKTLALVSITTLMLFFQNCSDIQSSMLLQGPEAAGGAAPAVVGTGDLNVLDPQGPGDTIVIDTPEVPITTDQANTGGDNEIEDDNSTEINVPVNVATNGDFAAACKDLKLFGIKNILIDAKNIEDVHGQVLIKSDKIDLIQDHSSVLVITGNTSVAMVNQIRNVHGLTVVCHAVVDRMESVFGTLVLVDSIVNNLDDQHGRLVLIRSKIGNRADGQNK